MDPSRGSEGALRPCAVEATSSNGATQDLLTAKTAEQEESERRRDAVQLPKIRKVLINQFKERGLQSIGHVGILLRWNHSSTSRPIFFFTKNTEEISLGSNHEDNVRDSKCDINFRNLWAEGMSGIAL